MKKLLLFLTCLTALGTLFASAAVQTLSIKGATGTLQDDSSVIFGSENLTYSKAKYLKLISFPETENLSPVIEAIPGIGSNTSNSPSYNKEGSLRLYSNNTLEIRAIDNKTISKLVFTLANTSKYTDPTVTNGSGSVDSNKTYYTWVADSETSNMTISMPSTSGKQFCFTDVTVTYETKGQTDPTPSENIITEIITAKDFNHNTSQYLQKSFTSTETGISYSAVFNGNNSLITFNSGNKNLGKHSEFVVTNNPKGYILKKISIEFNTDDYAKSGILAYAQTTNYKPADTSSSSTRDKEGDNLGTIGSGENMVAEISPTSSSYTAMALFPNKTSVIGMKSITLVWEMPLEPEEPAGDINVSHAKHFQLKEYSGDDYIAVMAGTPLIFTSEGAEHISVSIDIDGISSSETVDGCIIEWAAPLAEYDGEITVTATKDNGSQPVVKIYDLNVEEIEPEIPDYDIDENSQYIYIYSPKGALSVKIEEATEEPSSIMRIEAHDWMHPDGVYPKEYEIDYSNLNGIVRISAKSVTPITETNPISFYINENGLVSGIENVAADNASAEAVLYNLQGQRVEADCPGIYIRMQGGKAEKFIVR